MATEDPQFTIRELAAQAAALLAAHPVGRLNGRTREIADVRTLRYYTTLGLLDRPARWAGRTAYYGARHLAQLVCIKRLQAKGQTLAEIQARLLNASSDDLARLAELPELNESSAEIQIPATYSRSTTQEPTDRDCALEREPARVFWKTRPTAQVAVPPPVEPADQPAADCVLLDECVELRFTAARPPDDDDRAALRVAALPLLEVLRKRRLLP